MNETVHILGLPGSLRKGSYNRALLQAATEMLPPHTTMEIFDLDGIPVFNQDLEREAPPRVRELKAKVRTADAILFGVAEHNYGVSAALKNAIDWASRPYGDNVWAGKPVAMVSASIGMLGGARAQYQLRQTFVFLDMRPLSLPEVFVTFAPQKFDSQGRFTDPEGRKFLSALLGALVQWARSLKGAGSSRSG
jgi:chromate reductase